MSSTKDEGTADLFSDLLNDELGEWDKMFDSLHENSEDKGAKEELPPEFMHPFGESDLPSADLDFSLELGFEDEEEGTGELDVNFEAQEIADTSIFSSASATEGILDALLGGEDVAEPDDSIGDAVGSLDLEATAEDFFNDGLSDDPNEVVLELDDDFYDGIEIETEQGQGAVEVEAIASMRGIAHVVKRQLEPMETQVDIPSGGFENSQITAIRKNPLDMGNILEGAIPIPKPDEEDDGQEEELIFEVEESEVSEVSEGPSLPAAIFQHQAPGLVVKDVSLTDAEEDTNDRSEQLASLFERLELEKEQSGEDLPCIQMALAHLAEVLGALPDAGGFLADLIETAPSLSAFAAIRRVESALGQWESSAEYLAEERKDTSSPVLEKAVDSYLSDLQTALGNYDLANESSRSGSESYLDSRSLLSQLFIAFAEGREGETEGLLGELARAVTDADLGASMYGLAGSLVARHCPRLQESKTVSLFQLGNEKKNTIGTVLMLVGALSAQELFVDLSKMLAETLDLGEVSNRRSVLMPPAIRTALHWTLADALIRSGSEDSGRKRLEEALAEEGGESCSRMWLAHSMVRLASSDEQKTLAWTLFADTVKEPVWKSHAYLRASRTAVKEKALPLAAKATNTGFLDALTLSALRKMRVESREYSDLWDADRLQLESADFSPLLAFHAAESGSFVGKKERVDALLRSACMRENLELGALVWVGVERGIANDNPSLLAKCFALVAGKSEDVDLQWGLLRSKTAIAMAGQEAGELSEASSQWARFASSLSSSDPSGIDANWTGFLLALYARNSDESLTLAKELLEQTEDRDLWLSLYLTRQSKSDGAGQWEEQATEIQNSADSLCARYSEHGWTRWLFAGNWSEAIESLERVSREDIQDSARCRFLYRAAVLRKRYDIEPAIANESLQQVRDLYPTFGKISQGKRVENSSQEEEQPDKYQELVAPLRHAETLFKQGDAHKAVEAISILREKHPDDALVLYVFERFCWQAGASAELSGTLLSRLRIAEESEDMQAKAAICETLARVDLELRQDSSSALMFWESAWKALPERADLQRNVEREYVSRGQDWMRSRTMFALQKVMAESDDAGEQRSAYLRRAAAIAEKAGEPSTQRVRMYQKILQNDALNRSALFHLETEYRSRSAKMELAIIEGKIASYFSGDDRASAAFMVRSGETWRELENVDAALSAFQSAAGRLPSFHPAILAWSELALESELWEEFAEVNELKAAHGKKADSAGLYHLVGVVQMDKADNDKAAIAALEKALQSNPLHRDALVRLCVLLEKEGEYDKLVGVLNARASAEKQKEAPDQPLLCELYIKLAEVCRDCLDSPEQALEWYRLVLRLRPADRAALVGASRLAWSLQAWPEAAEFLMSQAKLEVDPAELKAIYHQLGTIYSLHILNPKWALKSYERIVANDANDTLALKRISILGVECGDYSLALGACEQLIRQDPPVEEKIEHLHQISRVFLKGWGNVMQAERALRAALDLDPSSELAFDELVAFFVGRNDLRSARVHMDRVALAMRTTLAKNPVDKDSYRILSRVMGVKKETGFIAAAPIEKAAASIAKLLGHDDPRFDSSMESCSPPRWLPLMTGNFDDLLWEGPSLTSAKMMFDLLSERIPKHLGIDAKAYGATRGDRRKLGADEQSQVVLQLCKAMGVDPVDWYVTKKTGVYAAISSRPISVILSSEFASRENTNELKFFLGRAIFFAKLGLSVPLKMEKEKFGAFLVAILRTVKEGFAPEGLEERAISAEQHRIRRMVPTSILQQLAPYAHGLASSDFNHEAIWSGLIAAGNRAGLLCSGDVGACIAALMKSKGIKAFALAMQDAEIMTLVRFAVSDDHGRLYGALLATEEGGVKAEAWAVGNSPHGLGTTV